jgi:hypothetical protein
MHLKKIISGGQTGVDRAALDAAMSLGIPHGGWCPAGRLAEDGIIPGKYQLSETESSLYKERTRLNVRDADLTLIIIQNGRWGSGTLFTKKACLQLQKQFFVADLMNTDMENLKNSLLEICENPVLNCAGNRESTSPGIYKESLNFFMCLFEGLRQ